MSEVSTTWVQGLKNPECYFHSVEQVKLIETHISWVVLTGCYAYKIKKPVKYSFVDFSTLEKRRWFCEEEVRLNRRLAPEVYLGIVPITGSPSNPHIDGHGPSFEFAVKMKQFSSEQEVYDILVSGEKAGACVSQLAERLAQFHAQIEKAGEHSPYGNPDMVWQPMQECLDEIPLHLLPPATQKNLAGTEEWLLKEWRHLYEVFVQRKNEGYVRECHGDLHLGNIAVFEGKVCVFDALEFEPRLRWIDVLSEVAFLVMDLEKHGREDLAFVFLNRYLELTGDYEGLVIFRFYQIYRALVRAKVAGLRLAQLEEDGVEKEKAKNELCEYVELAHRFVSCVPPVLIMMHGVSGTGKTTVSTEIVQAIGAIRVRSDVERKRLFAEISKTKTEDLQDDDLYHLDMTEHTYDRLGELARILLQAGFSVVGDATFLRQHQRGLFSRLAQEQACAWFIVDVFAPEAVLAERIKRRSREGRDASDATVAIMERQQEIDEHFTQAEQLHVIRVDSRDPQSIISAIKELKEKTGL
ncbi:MAG: AAA family ATPase [Nitrospirota bacterium]|nr:MAG: AAA family ATPase [Nitrospirota bacterium]